MAKFRRPLVALALLAADAGAIYWFDRTGHSRRVQWLTIATVVFFVLLILTLSFVSLFRFSRRSGFSAVAIFLVMVGWWFWWFQEARSSLGGPFIGMVQASIDDVRTKSTLPVLVLPIQRLKDPCTKKSQLISLRAISAQADWSQANFSYTHGLALDEAAVSDDFRLMQSDGVVRGRRAGFYLNERYRPELKPPCGEPLRTIAWVDGEVLYQVQGRFTWETLVTLATRARFVG